MTSQPLKAIFRFNINCRYYRSRIEDFKSKS